MRRWMVIPPSFFMDKNHNRIETEWYRNHRWTKYPDELAEGYLRARGEFGTDYEIAFSRHLKNLEKFSKGRYAP